MSTIYYLDNITTKFSLENLDRYQNVVAFIVCPNRCEDDAEGPLDTFVILVRTLNKVFSMTLTLPIIY